MKTRRILSLALVLILAICACTAAVADDQELLTLSALGCESSNTYVHLEDREKYPIWQVLMDMFA